jgi:hypothetical protein
MQFGQRYNSNMFSGRFITENKSAKMRLSPDDDFFFGSDRPEMVWGGWGHEVIHGRGGNDKLWGGPGNDAIHGGEGDDYIVGGPGRDIMLGGEGDDHIYAQTNDERIYVEFGDDTLHVSGTGRARDMLHVGWFDVDGDKLDIAKGWSLRDIEFGETTYNPRTHRTTTEVEEICINLAKSDGGGMVRLDLQTMDDMAFASYSYRGDTFKAPPADFFDFIV